MAKWTNRELKKLRSEASPYPWEDLRFPLSGFRLDSASSRYSYDFFNGGVLFDTNSRFPEEPLSMMVLMPHEWLEKDNIKPHIHWPQDVGGNVNWLLAYKKIRNGEDVTIEVSYGSHTLLAGTEVFTYTSGTIAQITSFGEIDMTDMRAADLVHVVLFKDSANTSGEFAGADNDDRLSYEMDVHYRKRGAYVQRGGVNVSGEDVYLGTYHEFAHIRPEYLKQYNIDK